MAGEIFVRILPEAPVCLDARLRGQDELEKLPCIEAVYEQPLCENDFLSDGSVFCHFSCVFSRLLSEAGGVLGWFGSNLGRVCDFGNAKCDCG